MNLLVTNLASSWILVPLILWDGSSFSWAPSLTASIWNGLTGAVYAQSVLSVMAVAVDQYYAVTDPLRYHVTVNAASCAVAVALTWCLSAVAGALSAVRELSVVPEAFRLTFPVTYVLLLYVMPFLSVCWVYVKICTAAHRNSERARRNGSVPDQLQQQQQQQQQPLQQNNNEYNIVPTIQEEEDDEAVEVKPTAQESDTPKPPPLNHSSTRASLKSTSSSIVNHLRYRISNASMFRYREESRAAKISVLVIVTAAACWTPYAAFKLSQWPPLIALGFIPSPGPLTALLSLSAHAVITPILFAHRNRRVHRELCRIFCRRKRCSSFYENVRNATVAAAVTPIKSTERFGGSESPLHVFSKWFGRPSAATSAFLVPTLTVPNAAHLPTDLETARSSFSSNGSSSTQASSVITVD
ncbi:beta-3 adrenergic receptor isoform X2 [Daktulosphaira vitifoliae]|nr:beta-3 adrenergic receptor isoform X2 [Daktulosphaira vitifoliae]